MKHIEQGWKALSRNMINDDMSDRQIEEMRLLFFLGAMHMHDIVLGIAADGNTGAVRRGRIKLESVVEELKEFGLLNYSGGHA